MKDFKFKPEDFTFQQEPSLLGHLVFTKTLNQEIAARCNIILREATALDEAINRGYATQLNKAEETLRIAQLDMMTIIEWAESHYPGLVIVPEWQSLKVSHRLSMKAIKEYFKSSGVK